MKFERPLWLASRSPRRLSLLRDAGFDVRVQQADIDDAMLQPGRVSPECWTMALAYLKARRVAAMLGRSWMADDTSAADVAGTIIGADTVCVVGDEILGQPRDANDVMRMLRLMRNGEHQTMTGVCLLGLATDDPHAARRLFVDVASVRIGALSDAMIAAYVESGDWRGKAGGYNLRERIDADWPIECIGDPATVMGLPMRRLAAMLASS